MTIIAVSAPIVQAAAQTLFIARDVDMTLTTDQAFTQVFTGTRYLVTRVLGFRKTGAYGVACLGGIYTAAAKGGVALLDATQSWADLTGALTVQQASILKILGTGINSALPILSLTTGNTGALTATIVMHGICVDDML